MDGSETHHPEPCAPRPAVSVEDFRIDFPEFADPSKYTSRRIERLVDLAQKQLDPTRWQDMWCQGISLWTAHFLAVGARNAQPSAVPGQQGLPLSKTVGRASVDYDTGATTITGAGPWNLTTYGTQLIWWARRIGAGGMQINGAMERNIYQVLTLDPQNYGFIGIP